MLLEPLFVGDGKLLPAAPPAFGQHRPALGGLHALAEAVRVLSLPPGGLIGPFHTTVVLVRPVGSGCGEGKDNEKGEGDKGVVSS